MITVAVTVDQCVTLEVVLTKYISGLRAVCYTGIPVANIAVALVSELSVTEVAVIPAYVTTPLKSVADKNPVPSIFKVVRSSDLVTAVTLGILVLVS